MMFDDKGFHVKGDILHFNDTMLAVLEGNEWRVVESKRRYATEAASLAVLKLSDPKDFKKLVEHCTEIYESDLL